MKLWMWNQNDYYVANRSRVNYFDHISSRFFLVAVSKQNFLFFTVQCIQKKMWQNLRMWSMFIVKWSEYQLHSCGWHSIRQREKIKWISVRDCMNERVINWQYFAVNLYSVSDRVERRMGAIIDSLNITVCAVHIVIIANAWCPNWVGGSMRFPRHLSIIEERCNSDRPLRVSCLNLLT